MKLDYTTQKSSLLSLQERIKLHFDVEPQSSNNFRYFLKGSFMFLKAPEAAEICSTGRL